MPARRLFSLIVAVALLALAAPVALAGGGGGGGGPCAGFGSGPVLVMLDNCFNAVAHSVEPGATLRVRNDGELPHTFTAVDGSFDSGVLQPGQSAEIRVGEAGVFGAYCTLHGSKAGGGMAGALVVGSPAAASAGAGPLQLSAVGLAGVVLGGGAAWAYAGRRRAAAPVTAAPAPVIAPAAPLTSEPGD
jgi:hypothetical protein